MGAWSIFVLVPFNRRGVLETVAIYGGQIKRLKIYLIFGTECEHFQRDKVHVSVESSSKVVKYVSSCVGQALVQSQMQKRGNPQHSEFEFNKGKF